MQGSLGVILIMCVSCHFSVLFLICENGTICINLEPGKAAGNLLCLKNLLDIGLFMYLCRFSVFVYVVLLHSYRNSLTCV